MQQIANSGLIVNVFLMILFFFIILIIITIFLKIALGFIGDSEDTEFGSVFGTTLFVVLIIYFFYWLFSNYILHNGYIGLIIAMFAAFLIISARHDISYLSAIVVTILAIVIFIVVIYIISFLLGLSIIPAI